MLEKLEKLRKELNIKQDVINEALKTHAANAARMRGGRQQQQQQQQQQQLQQLQQQQQQQQQQQIAGNVKVYTGPKQGKFIINKHGKKVYIDRKTLNNNVPYLKKKAKK